MKEIIFSAVLFGTFDFLKDIFGPIQGANIAVLLLVFVIVAILSIIIAYLVIRLYLMLNLGKGEKEHEDKVVKTAKVIFFGTALIFLLATFGIYLLNM